MTMMAICKDNKEWKASLKVGRSYEVVEDPSASAKGLIRVIDESMESCLYDSEMFGAPLAPPLTEEAPAVR